MLISNIAQSWDSGHLPVVETILLPILGAIPYSLLRALFETGLASSILRSYDSELTWGRVANHLLWINAVSILIFAAILNIFAALKPAPQWPY